MARVLVTYYAPDYRTNEERDHASLPEPSAIMNVPHFTLAPPHKDLSILDTGKCSDLDDLHSFMLQILVDFLAQPITSLHNKSPQSGKVPQDWGKAMVCPIFKKWDPEDAANYRL